ncbi:MAG TPA: hypothetical protein HA366_03685 [Candidatus Methanomethylophilaceae archaeon]|nr:hypothetical protein [Candidatus Methanomethylophilaceae archaeon]
MTETLRPDQVKDRYGKLFCKGFYTIVDEKNGVAQVIERCIARGPPEWDAVNRKRAGGVVTDVRVDGHTLIMDTVIGERELHFGPVAEDVGGQGLRSLRLEGDTVVTKWVGLAGATVGIGACIPQAPEVMNTIYPDDFHIGGAHCAEVEVRSPKMVRVILGVDDTDTKEQGASWSMMLKMGQECPFGHFLEHKIIQLNPLVPDKTTNCCSTAVSFAVEEKEMANLLSYARDFLRDNPYSDDTVMAYFMGLKVPSALEDFGWRCKSEIFTIDDARRVALDNGISLCEITGEKGTIGAVAAIGCFDMGLRAAGLPQDFK